MFVQLMTFQTILSLSSRELQHRSLKRLGQCQFQFLLRIFRIFGTPDYESWPSLVGYPSFSRKFPKFERFFESLFCRAMPREAFDLLQKMLIYEPTERITAAVALQHPFLVNIQ